MHFQCETCGRIFSTKQAAAEWRRQHCSKCPNRFNCPCRIERDYTKNLKSIYDPIDLLLPLGAFLAGLVLIASVFGRKS